MLSHFIPNTLLNSRLLRRVFGLALLAIVASTVPGEAQVSTVTATTMRTFKAVRGADATVTNSALTWVDLPGAQLTFTVPAGETDMFDARFAAESVCWGVSGWCSVRVVINDTIEMLPTVGFDFAFDSTDGGTASSGSWESHATERSKLITAGSSPVPVTIKVQYATTDSGISLRLDDWQFTVQQLK